MEDFTALLIRDGGEGTTYGGMDNIYRLPSTRNIFQHNDNMYILQLEYTLGKHLINNTIQVVTHFLRILMQLVCSTFEN